MTVQQLCRHIIQLIHTPIQVYTPSGQPVASYVNHGEQQDLFSCDPGFVRTLLDHQDPDCPRLYLEWGRIAYGVAGDGEEVYLLGPCCLDGEAISAASYLVRAHHMDRRQPYRVARVPLRPFLEVLAMLFETLTGRPVTGEEILRRSFQDEALRYRMQEKLSGVFYDLGETQTIHNPYRQEQLEQESIRTGDLEGLRRSVAIPYVGTVGTLARDPLRNAKNTAIVLITLASRSAIAGGVLPEVAYSMSDALIQQVEELDHMGEVLALARQAEEEYCLAVQARSASRRQHPLILRCKELILQNLHARITTAELAAQLDITPGYLSKLFQREEGVRLVDYVAREKIRQAKNRLIYTGDSYEAIALTLGFSSQSHFGQVFKKWTGMTPGGYREQYRNSLTAP